MTTLGSESKAFLLETCLGKVDVRLPARMVDVRLPGQGNSNPHGARPVHLIITMIKWIRASRLSMKISLSDDVGQRVEGVLARDLLRGV